MKKAIFVLCGLFAITTMVSTISARVPISTLQQNQVSIAPMLKQTMPGVVNIVSRGEIQLADDPFLKRELSRFPTFQMLDKKHFASLGSGVIIDADRGLIVTNAHLVDLEKTITVTLSDGRHFDARKIGADNDTDIALIQINAKNLTAIPMANSHNLHVGDFVVAIGSPFGLKQSVTAGIISALNRGNLGIEGIENFIQTDAPINIGNSGGALVNMNGQLVGINTAIMSPTGTNLGIGFAIPSNMVHSIVSQLLEFGKVHRGLMGILVQTLSPDLANAFNVPGKQGAIVSQVVPFSPAAKAGIKKGDIITAINDHNVVSNDDIHNFVGLLRIGDTAKLTILRNDKTLLIPVVTADPKTSEAEKIQADAYFYGVKMENIVSQNSSHGYVQGIHVSKVNEYSPAWTSGLRPNDVIIEANHKPVKSIAELMLTAKKASSKNSIMLRILRGPGAIFIVIK